MTLAALEAIRAAISPKQGRAVRIAKQVVIWLWFRNPHDVAYGCSFVSEVAARVLRELGYSAETVYGFHRVGYEHAWLVTEGRPLDLKNWILHYQNGLAPQTLDRRFPSGVEITQKHRQEARREIYCRAVDAQAPARDFLRLYRDGSPDVQRATRPSRKEQREYIQKRRRERRRKFRELHP